VNSERPDTEEKIQLNKQMTAIHHQLQETENSLLNLMAEQRNHSTWIEGAFLFGYSLYHFLFYCNLITIAVISDRLDDLKNKKIDNE